MVSFLTPAAQSGGMTQAAVGVLWKWFLSRDGVVTDEIWSAYGTIDCSGALLRAEQATGSQGR